MPLLDEFAWEPLFRSTNPTRWTFSKNGSPDTIILERWPIEDLANPGAQAHFDRFIARGGRQGFEIDRPRSLTPDELRRDAAMSSVYFHAHGPASLTSDDLALLDASTVDDAFVLVERLDDGRIRFEGQKNIRYTYRDSGGGIDRILKRMTLWLYTTFMGREFHDSTRCSGLDAAN